MDGVSLKLKTDATFWFRYVEKQATQPVLCVSPNHKKDAERRLGNELFQRIVAERRRALRSWKPYDREKLILQER